MRRFALAAVAFVAAVGLTSADDAEKAAKEIEGTYAVKSFEKNGKAAPKEFVDRVELVELKGGKFTVKIKGEPDDVVEYKLDPSKKPATIDLTKDADKPKKLVGIYKFEKGELTIVTVQKGDRPKEFKSDNDATMMVFTKKDK